MKKHPNAWYVFAAIPLLLIVFILLIYEFDRNAIGWISVCVVSVVAALLSAKRAKAYQSKLRSDEYLAEKEWIEENIRFDLAFADVKDMIDARFKLRVSDRSYSARHGSGRCHDFESDQIDLRILEKKGKIVEVKIDASY